MNPMRNIAFLVALVTFTSSAASAETTDDAKRLAGTWEGTGGAWRGKALTAEQARQCILLLHPPRPTFGLSGGSRGMDLVVPDKLVGYEIWEGTRYVTRYVTEWRDYAFTLNPSSKPPVLNAHKQIGIKGHGFAGIYRIEADSLTICINFNRLGALPKEFKSPSGSEVLLLTLKRSK